MDTIDTESHNCDWAFTQDDSDANVVVELKHNRTTVILPGFVNTSTYPTAICKYTFGNETKALESFPIHVGERRWVSMVFCPLNEEITNRIEIFDTLHLRILNHPEIQPTTNHVCKTPPYGEFESHNHRYEISACLFVGN